MAMRDEEKRAEEPRASICPQCGALASTTVASPYPYCSHCGRYIFPRAHAESAQGEAATGRAARSSPADVKIFCSLWSIASLVGMGLGVFVVDLGLRAGSGLLVFLGALQVVLGLAQAFSVFGLWSLRYWGWQIAVVLTWISLVLHATSLLQGDVTSLISLAGAGAFLLYLYARRRLFL